LSLKTVYNKNKNKKYKRNKSSKINYKIKLILFTCIFILLAITSININSNYKCKDLDYAIKKYTTSGVFNQYKLYSMDNYEIKFSDSTYAIIEVTGIENKAPYKSVKYNLHLKKNSKGTWKVKEYNPRS